MARLLRMLMLLVSIVAMQLTSLSGGAGCPMPLAGDASMEFMNGPAMRGMAMTAGDDAADLGKVGDAERPAPCDESTAPGFCATMTPCVFAILPVLAQGAAPVARTPSRIDALRVLTPSPVTTAPELHTPRA